MKLRGLRHDQYQLALPGVDASTPLTSWQQASGVVGEFFELFTAQMLDGVRRAVTDVSGRNPDVVARASVFESKAAGRGRWLLQAEQHDVFAQHPHGYYVLWSYAKPPCGLVAYRSVQQLRAWLGQNVTGCTVMPSSYPDKILAGTPHAAPRCSNDLWGPNYWFRARYLREVLDGERTIDADYHLQARTVDVREVIGVPLAPVTATWFIPMAARPAITDDDVARARVALHELATQRHWVVLVPLDRGPGMRRVVASENPKWYRVFINRRQKPPVKWRDRNRFIQPKTPQTRGGYRPLVRLALERIATRRPNPQRTWIGWELLEILRDLDPERAGQEGGHGV